jgi:hypothetical protein
MKKIICLSTEGGDREDGSVYYSEFVIVESATLAFNEPVFKERVSSQMSIKAWIAAVRGLGYTVEEPENEVIILDDLS